MKIHEISNEKFVERTFFEISEISTSYDYILELDTEGELNSKLINQLQKKEDELKKNGKTIVLCGLLGRDQYISEVFGLGNVFLIENTFAHALEKIREYQKSQIGIIRKNKEKNKDNSVIVDIKYIGIAITVVILIFAGFYLYNNEPIKTTNPNFIISEKKSEKSSIMSIRDIPEENNREIRDIFSFAEKHQRKDISNINLVKPKEKDIVEITTETPNIEVVVVEKTPEKTVEEKIADEIAKIKIMAVMKENGKISYFYSYNGKNGVAQSNEKLFVTVDNTSVDINVIIAKNSVEFRDGSGKVCINKVIRGGE